MRKIMFNDKFGLTQAVLDGRKTMTRRIIRQSDLDKVEEYQLLYYNAALDSISFEDALCNMANEGVIRSAYKACEVVAIAQSYKDCGWTGNEIIRDPKTLNRKGIARFSAGWTNKLFVRAEACQNKIRITDIKVERLQDISDEDCLKEGVYYCSEPPKFSEYDHFCPWPPTVKPYKWATDNFKFFCKPQFAFAYLIDKVSGKGTWDSNPYVFAYSFELLR